MASRIMPDRTITIGVETEGMDEAAERIERITDALGNIPPQVIIKGCKNCDITIHPTQAIAIRQGGENNE